ncbi:hypothetical protein [Sulfurisphaera ohwakuensis]|uniref:ElaB/YqjD/DUF883 family membrane-anchored ribosome-binding protein n=1 Tax=Sulfurisphaera ohwakuensis TaxID=69656 RepID=A0A650CE92_SULOH|nr:hypothetical protein [Sulfurisphaera ohwakuensis]MBB5253214.1 ElaB/YqjD/DUF883 family membrane-anchored ribosome-binding protein [Sulfurisphaera ohwakuensis]QGR15877.1 hypothetical protein D1869_00720 [Sulfurisphaera ohwakuensis]
MELEKLVSQIKKKKYGSKKELIKDLNLLMTEIHNQIKSEISRAKKANKNVNEIEKEIEKILHSIKKVRKNKQAQSIRNIKFVVDRRGLEALELLKKLKSS